MTGSESVSSPPNQRSTWRAIAGQLGLALVELGIAGVFGFGLFIATFKLGCGFTRCVDVQGLPWVILGLLLAVTISPAYWVVAILQREHYRRRLLLDAVILLLGVAGIAMTEFRVSGNSETTRITPPAKIAPAPVPARPIPRIGG